MRPWLFFIMHYQLSSKILASASGFVVFDDCLHWILFSCLQLPPSPQQVGLTSPQINTVPFDFYKQPPRLPLPAMVSKQVQVCGIFHLLSLWWFVLLLFWFWLILFCSIAWSNWRALWSSNWTGLFVNEEYSIPNPSTPILWWEVTPNWLHDLIC